MAKKDSTLLISNFPQYWDVQMFQKILIHFGEYTDLALHSTGSKPSVVVSFAHEEQAKDVVNRLGGKTIRNHTIRIRHIDYDIYGDDQMESEPSEENQSQQTEAKDGKSKNIATADSEATTDCDKSIGNKPNDDTTKNVAIESKDENNKNNLNKDGTTRMLPERTLFVSNIPDGTSDDELRALFGTVGTIIMMRRLLSKRVGAIAFIEFEDKTCIERALKLERGQRTLHGETMIVQKSRPKKRKLEDPAPTPAKRRKRGSSGNIKVTDLKEEVTKEMLASACSCFGTVVYSNIHMDTSVDPPRSRGFGVVMFESPAQAGRALRQGYVEVAGQTANIVKVNKDRYRPRKHRPNYGGAYGPPTAVEFDNGNRGDAVGRGRGRGFADRSTRGMTRGRGTRRGFRGRRQTSYGVNNPDYAAR